MKIALACDHAGYDLKPAIANYLVELGYEIVDLGTNSHESVDYPDYGFKAGETVASGECDLGIVICGTGIGISLAANKVPGIRCAAVSDTYSAHRAREHNNANMLAFGSRVVGEDLAKDIVKAFLEVEFEGGRHARRVDKISAYEKALGADK